jgi:ribosomal protein S18 acetylase RimI-like enzyme
LEPLINEAYLRETWLLPPPRITLPQLEDVLSDPEQSVTVAEIDGHPAGTVRLSRHDGDLYFGLLAVSPAWQGRGLASMLIREAERQASELGEITLRLDCAKELGLPHYYERLGYVVESETPNSYYDDRQSGRRKGPFTLVVLKKELHH